MLISVERFRLLETKFILFLDGLCGGKKKRTMWKMAEVIWRDTMIAKSGKYETVDGNVYVLPRFLKREVVTEVIHTASP